MGISIPGMKPRASSPGPRDRRFYQAIRPPRPDSAEPGTPADPAVELSDARRTVNGYFPRLKVYREDPTDYVVDQHRSRTGNAPGGEPVAAASLGVAARSFPEFASIRETTEQPLPLRAWAHRASFSNRASRLLDAQLEFVEHESFNDPDARDTILAPLPEPAPGPDTRGGESRESRGPRPTSFRATPLLSREEEAHLFRKMNFLKFLASRLHDGIDPAHALAAELDEIERLLTEAVAIRNRIIEANQRLVFSIAHKHTRPGEDLSERVSDGNFALIRAVDLFDYARGNKFSTYASWAIINGLSRRKRIQNDRVRFVPGDGVILQSAVDMRADEHALENANQKRVSQVERWLAQLDGRERRIIDSHYGTGGAKEKTLREIGNELGISKERVRQIEGRAHEKLRGLAREEAIELLPA